MAGVVMCHGYTKPALEIAACQGEAMSHSS